MAAPRPQAPHPSGSPICSACGHTKLMHNDNGAPCSAASCRCKVFKR